MKISLLVLVMLFIASYGLVQATAGPVISISPPAVTLTPGSSVTYEFRVSEVPSGLSGYEMQVKLTNPAAGQITRVSFPSWAKLAKTSPLPSDNVSVSAVDLTKEIGDGASGVGLVSITVTATGAGTSNVKIQGLSIEDDHNGAINADLVTAKLTTLPGGSSGSGSPSDGAGSHTTVPTTMAELTPPETAIPNTATPVFTTELPAPVITPASTNPPPEMSFSAPVPEAAPQVGIIDRIPRWVIYGFGLIALISALLLLYLSVTKKI
jgi:hypothetical protein